MSFLLFPIPLLFHVLFTETFVSYVMSCNDTNNLYNSVSKNNNITDFDTVLFNTYYSNLPAQTLA